MYRIFIVEDDEVIAQLVAAHLQKWGFETACAADFANVDKACAAFAPHLVLMDISLPFYDGYWWCAKIRQHSAVPIIFISSRSENMDIVMAVNMGGDDYIIKPFAPEVLTAKVQALLRRAYSYKEDTARLSAKGAVFDPAASTLNTGSKHIELTRNEARIIRLLLENKGQIVSREKMMQALWDSDCFIDDNTLTVNIGRLRTKLKEHGIDEFITTKKGQGYLVAD